MSEILSRCGYRCDMCLAYRANIQAHPENAQLDIRRLVQVLRLPRPTRKINALAVYQTLLRRLIQAARCVLRGARGWQIVLTARRMFVRCCRNAWCALRACRKEP